MRPYESRNLCALTQLPFAAQQPVSTRSLRALSRTAPLSCDIYRIKPRITHVDRAIIRGYFHQQDPAKLLHPACTATPFPEPHKQRLPTVLECRLSVLPPGYERVQSGHDALLIETASRRIVDVMRDIYAAI